MALTRRRASRAHHTHDHHAPAASLVEAPAGAEPLHVDSGAPLAEGRAKSPMATLADVAEITRRMQGTVDLFMTRAITEIGQLREQVATHVETKGIGVSTVGQLTADSIVILGPDGEPGITLGFNAVGPVVKLKHEGGAIELAINADGAPSILVSHGPDREERVSLGLVQDIHDLWLPQVEVCAGESGAKLAVDHVGPALSFTQDGHVVFDAFTNADETGTTLSFQDTKENQRLTFGLGREGAPQATFYGQAGDELAKIGLMPDDNDLKMDGAGPETSRTLSTPPTAHALEALARALEDTVFVMDDLRDLEARVNAVFRKRQAAIENGGAQ